ncbi:hypothetical protein [Oceanibium sediminis]|uniref:hypothetical protein n=1 Tax=Oceanibium sediminis TaxID=2026339 RepID=UPI000DD32F0F|nr:hypothetical protein [Oceanibium sediminis]
MTRNPAPSPSNPEDALLDAGFAALRNTPPPLPDGFEQRLTAQALRAMPVAPGPVAERAGLLSRIAAQLGGWQAGVAFGGAAMAGLSLGFFDPGGLISTQSGMFEIAESGATMSAEVSDGIFDDPLAQFEAELGS